VFPLSVYGVFAHVLPLKAESVMDGGLAHPQATVKLVTAEIQPDAFLALSEWDPLATPVNKVPDWYAPPSRLYWIPAPIGLVTVILAFGFPSEQSVDCVGAAGVPGAGAIITLSEAGEVQPAALVTVKLYVFGARFEMVVEVVFPDIGPGLIVQLPAGRPLNTTLPVGEAQVGWVMVPTVGFGILVAEILKVLGALVPQLEVVVTVKVPETKPAVKLPVAVLEE
jgi:hypothetical protein